MGAVRASILFGAVALFALVGGPAAWAAEAEASVPEIATTAPSPTEPTPPQAADVRVEEPAAITAETKRPAAETMVDQSGAPEITLSDVPRAAVAITGADRLPGMLAARLNDARIALHPRLARKEREAVSAFYALGNYQPMWSDKGGWTASAQALIERLKKADEDGLNGSDYAVPPLQGISTADNVEAVAEAELKLSAAAVVYARDARGGRIEPSRLSNLITPDLNLPAADAVLTTLAAAADAGAALADYHPRHAGFRALKSKLAGVRAQGQQARLEGDIVVNMERWRWLPVELGARHVFVNVPEFRLRLIKDGRPIHEARVIVGKPETPTPLFSDEMDHAVVNPSWYVPPSIFKNEFHSDPYLAAARGYDVVRTKNGGISVRQPPGERNALGFVKFMFPNQHAVYLHDTPNRRLFAAEKRAMSHGCVRLDQPFRFGEFVLGSEWTEARLRSLIGRGERSIRLPEKIPVHLAYFTAYVDEKGELRHFNDLYGINNKVRVALGLPRDGTAVAEAPRPRKVARDTAVADASRARMARAQVRRAPVRTAVRAPAPAAELPFFWWLR